MDLSKYTKEQLLEALAKIDAKIVEEEKKEELVHKFVVGTRDKDGKVAVFRVATDTIKEAEEEVKSAMVDDGVEKPLILSLIIGGKTDEVVPCDPSMPELA